jgi:hypothetical protein
MLSFVSCGPNIVYKHSDYDDALKALELPEYPFVQLPERLKVLKILTDIFLGTNSVREEILNEGNIQYDDVFILNLYLSLHTAEILLS